MYISDNLKTIIFSESSYMFNTYIIYNGINVSQVSTTVSTKSLSIPKLCFFKLIRFPIDHSRVILFLRVSIKIGRISSRIKKRKVISILRRT